jgi:hypothetical protein
MSHRACEFAEVNDLPSRGSALVTSKILSVIFSRRLYNRDRRVRNCSVPRALSSPFMNSMLAMSGFHSVCRHRAKSVSTLNGLESAGIIPPADAGADVVSANTGAAATGDAA